MAGQLKQRIKRAVISAGLEVSFGLSRLGISKAARGRGVVFTLHHVRPAETAEFQPNRHLDVTPEFLDSAITALKRDGYRFIRLDDMPAALAEPEPAQPFAVFTLDDGFRDNAVHALPVFERHGVPFTIFVCKGLSERSHSMWWETAAALIAKQKRLTLCLPACRIDMDCGTVGAKQAAFDAVVGAVFAGDEAKAVAHLDAAAQAAGINPHALVAETVMDHGELEALVRHPLVSYGAHTVSHRGLGALSDTEILAELNDSADYVASITGMRPVTFAYPYGDARSASPRTAGYAQWAGFKLAVTTRPGTLTEALLDAPQLLPRISLNGLYQKPRYVQALASGIPSRLKKG
ncbi:polysaccharide deacetylase [Rhizobium sp. Root274]|uniref:polysaccharide deacetylase family protein n=1 Tax=unclassified Rhizobium TaxID=2613769 RepID=UPI00071598A5|nr:MULTISPECIES: polysaccharide deacetylase family protein [unclassified Rhizobium]KQW32309.1 polysaccharide deacetylase [Rhizobium sp. Root1240]KRD33854.1 polysaccharide deacetylase [Rhizobium sp. Root274]